MVKRSLPVTIAAILFFGTTLVQAYEVRVEEVINNPTVIYKKALSVDVTLGIWNRVLDNPCLMGRLWEIYKFQPSYKVTKVDTGIHVSDPSGITGDIRRVGQSDHARTFYGTGRFDHWAVPSFFTANGVAIFEYKTDRNRLSGEVKIFMRGNNGISRFVMKIFSGILTRRINNRIENNLEDMKKIIRDIANDPHKVREALAGQLMSDFNKVFPVMEIKPAKE
ncbi:MAG: hypothetical protein JRD43_05640 [Deltaproteobacteria bacterium]|nr:hypothetical protein [Deltaproteobacteria bacterium]MBW2594751.1 hypothetical protein [Deltaproteobacteria bacterium]